VGGLKEDALSALHDVVVEASGWWNVLKGPSLLEFFLHSTFVQPMLPAWISSLCYPSLRLIVMFSGLYRTAPIDADGQPRFSPW
jgi:hypothetical protein